MLYRAFCEGCVGGRCGSAGIALAPDALSTSPYGGVTESGIVLAVEAEFSEGDSDDPLDLSPLLTFCRWGLFDEKRRRSFRKVGMLKTLSASRSPDRQMLVVVQVTERSGCSQDVTALQVG